jgi:predicted dehydrogenase
MLQAQKPDAAIVCTPNHTHVAVSKELLDNGINVLVEKPISTDVGSGKELVSRKSM